MDFNEQRELVSFLVGASRASLSEFFLARLNRAANLEREFRELSRRLVENAAFVELAELLRDHGEEIVANPPEERLLNGAAPKRVQGSLPANPWFWFWQDRSFSRAEGVLLQMIVMHSDSAGVCKVSIAELCADSRFKRAYVFRLLSILESKGVLKRKRTGGFDEFTLYPNAPIRFRGEIVQPEDVYSSRHQRSTEVDNGSPLQRTSDVHSGGDPMSTQVDPSYVLQRKAGARTATTATTMLEVLPPGFLQELSRIVPLFEDQAAKKLWDECRKRVPDCSAEEVLHFLRDKAAICSTGKIRNPVGFLLRAVPECFESQGFREYRKLKEGKTE
jgi:hypothetical protein